MPKVIVVGCGIVGPVMAIMLKKKGYDAVIVERSHKLGGVGGSLALFPNGLKVLASIGEVHLERSGVAYREGMEFTDEGEHLGGYDMSYMQATYGFPAVAIRRATLLNRLKESAIELGVSLLQGWELQDIRDTKDGVVAVAKDGREIEASLLVGCDGVHSVARSVICRKHGITEPAADYTGLVSWGGFSPIPKALPSRTGCGWYGNGKYFISYEVDDTQRVWAITMPRDEEKEVWRQAEDLAETKSTVLEELAGWPETVRGLVEKTENVVKFGLYDRPELAPEHWFHGRSVLAGEAAHPTSPHLGQGANQGLEDCWHLSQMLPDANEVQNIADVRDAFRSYAEKRQPRTAQLVKGARAQGQVRVTVGEEACKKRNEMVKKMWQNKTAMWTRMDSLYREPF